MQRFSIICLRVTLIAAAIAAVAVLAALGLRYHDEASGLGFSGARERFVAALGGFKTGAEHRAAIQKQEERDIQQQKARMEKQRAEEAEFEAQTIRDPQILANLERAVELGGFNCPRAVTAYRQSPDEFGQPFLVTCIIGSSAVMYSLTVRPRGAPLVKVNSRFSQ